MMTRYHRAAVLEEPTPVLNSGDQPLFSLCHTTARLPDGWKKAEQTWYERCDRPETVEYLLGWDSNQNAPEADLYKWGSWKHVVNMARRCAVDGWNSTSRASTGKFLITVADDWFPCKHWDTEILKHIPDLDGQYVLDVNTGGNRGLLTFSMLTRSYYERLATDHGYTEGFFYPQYLGMVADDDFTACARMDGVVINAQRLFFQHFHPDYGTAPMDPTYQHQHRDQAFAVGNAVFARRQRQGFRA